MSSFEKRIKNNINSGIAGPIWKNEKNTLEKILKELEQYGYEAPNGVTRFFKMDGSYGFSYGVADIVVGDEIYYSINADEVGHVLLAKIQPDKVEIPQYGTDMYKERNSHGQLKPAGFAKSGELPLSEVKDTIIETIEKTVKEHPVMGKYAHMILGDFSNILSLDPEREITHISEEAIINATLLEDNARKDAKISRLQTMLNRTLEFAINVRDSVVGKIFFRNKIAQLNLPEGELPEGDKDER